jgi:SulP family sulfate permease
MEKFFNKLGIKPAFLDSFKGYNGKTLSQDLVSGLMVAIVALPLSIAFALQSGFTLQAGIVTAIIGGFFIAALAGNKFSIGGPAAAFIVITAGYVANPEIGVSGVLIIAIAAGVLQIIVGLIKVGKLLKFVPFPIILGFTAGVGFVLLFGQLKDFLGLTLSGANPNEFIEKFVAYGGAIKTFNYQAFIAGAVTLGLIFGINKINKKLPSVIIAAIVVTLLCALFESIFKDGFFVETVGDKYGNIEPEITPIFAISFSSVKFSALIVPILVIAFLSSLEGLMSAAVAEGMTNTRFDANAELIAHGFANIGSGLLGGLPVTGVVARTSVNISGGGKTPLAGIFHSLFLAVMFVCLMPAVKFVPFSVLAAVLIKVSIGMIRLPVLAPFIKFSKRDTGVFAVTLLLTIFLDLVYGVGIGLATAFIFNIKFLKTGFKYDINSDNEKNPVLSLHGSLNFVSCVKFYDKLVAMRDTVESLTLDCAEIKTFDTTSAEKIVKIKREYEHSGKHIIFINVTPLAQSRLKRSETLSAH